MLFVNLERMVKMKRLCIYLKNSFAIALVIMLVLSMMSGVMSLSASADEEEFPVVKNEPTLLYKDMADSYYSPYYSDRSWFGAYQDIVLLMDDNNSSHKLNNILGISYKIYI